MATKVFCIFSERWGQLSTYTGGPEEHIVYDINKETNLVFYVGSGDMEVTGTRVLEGWGISPVLFNLR